MLGETIISELVYKNRELEMKYISRSRSALIKVFNLTVYFVSQGLVAAATFIPYYYATNSLEPSLVYVVLTMFGIFGS